MSASVRAAAEIAANSFSRRRARRPDRNAAAANASISANAAPRAIHTAVGITFTKRSMYLTLLLNGEVKAELPVVGCLAERCVAECVPAAVARAAVPVPACRAGRRAGGAGGGGGRAGAGDQERAA